MEKWRNKFIMSTSDWIGSYASINKQIGYGVAIQVNHMVFVVIPLCVHVNCPLCVCVWARACVCVLLSHYTLSFLFFDLPSMTLTTDWHIIISYLYSSNCLIKQLPLDLLLCVSPSSIAYIGRFQFYCMRWYAVAVRRMNCFRASQK